MNKCITKGRRSTGFLMVIAITIVGLATSAWAKETEDPGPIQLAQAAAEPAPEPVATTETVETTEPAEEFSSPFGFSLSYWLMTDYVFRGINYSEPANEGRELLNHQLTVSFSFDLNALKLGDLGTIGYDTWFEWYAGQKKLDPDKGGQNLQEVDYTVWWTRDFDAIATNLKLAYTFYEYVNLANTLRKNADPGDNNDDRTQEYSITLAHNDAWMWKWLLPDNEDGVLNPTFFFAHDVGAFPGVWMELGISHTFDVPGIENLTVTPGYTLAMQGSYYARGFWVAGDTLSLSVDYDLTPLLKLPPWMGSIVWGGKLYYFNDYGNMRKIANDEFWGGTTVTWSWGG